MQATLLSLAITLSAPALKERPMETIVGEWVVESTQSTGKVRPIGGNKEELRYIFSDKGTLTVLRGERKIGGDDRGYTIDPKKSPATIDLIADTTDMETPITKGLFKIEGDRLTMIISRSRADRPKAFEISQDSPGTIYIMKRAKPKN